MKAVAVVFGLVCASSGVRADPQLVGAAAFGSEGGVALTGSDEEVGPRDWDCRHWQKIQEAKGNGPMDPCDEGSRYCDRPEFFCDLRSDRKRGSRARVEALCGASPGNEQRSENSCGDVHCRAVPECMCGGESRTCMRKTCASLQRENCPNSMPGGGACKAGEETCDVDGFECDLRRGRPEKFACTATGGAQNHTRGTDPDTNPKDDGSDDSTDKTANKPADKPADTSAGDAVRTQLLLTSVVGLVAAIASAMNRV